MVAAGGDEEDVAGRAPAGDAARLGDDVEAEHADSRRPSRGRCRRCAGGRGRSARRGRWGAARPRSARRCPARECSCGHPAILDRMRLSVLDQSPIPEGSTGAQALRNTLDLARAADRLGYHRYWVAEHHGGGMLAGPGARGADRPDRVRHRADPRRQRRRDAPALQPAQGGGELQPAERALPGPDRPRHRPRRRHRPGDHARAPARPPPGAARRLLRPARGAARLPRGPLPGRPPAQAADRAAGPARGARAVAARLLAAERDLGRRPRPAVRVRGLHQLRRRRRDRAPVPRALRRLRAAGHAARRPSRSGRSPPTPRRRRSGWPTRRGWRWRCCAAAG